MGTERSKRDCRTISLMATRKSPSHVISTQEAMRQIHRFYLDDTVAVPNLMSVKRRGKVRHFASIFLGTLIPSNSVWVA